MKSHIPYSLNLHRLRTLRRSSARINSLRICCDRAWILSHQRRPSCITFWSHRRSHRCNRRHHRHPSIHRVHSTNRSYRAKRIQNSPPLAFLDCSPARCLCCSSPSRITIERKLFSPSSRAPRRARSLAESIRETIAWAALPKAPRTTSSRMRASRRLRSGGVYYMSLCGLHYCAVAGKV